MKFICLIPARKNSTRLKNKNILKLSNKPLIYWTVKLAEKCKYFDKIVVSSDNSEIKKILKIFKSVDFIHRPKIISGKKTKMESVLNHAIKNLKKENKKYDAAVILQPTSPLRRLKTIEKCCRIFSSNKYDTLATVTKLDFKSDPSRLIKFSKKELIKKNFDYNYNLSNKFYKLDGGVIFIKKLSSMKKKILEGRTKFYEVKYPESIDIDTNLDFKQAGLFFNKNDIYKQK